MCIRDSPGDVQGDIRGVHNALDKAEVIGQEVRALVHNHDPGGIELKPLLKVRGLSLIHICGLGAGAVNLHAVLWPRMVSNGTKGPLHMTGHAACSQAACPVFS